MRDLAGGPRRFVELQRTLPGISTEQLRSRLNRMVADGLLTRQRYREVPPRVDYELTPRSRALLPVVGELARWGYGFAWGPPRPGERVDVGAVLRAATGLEMSRSHARHGRARRRPSREGRAAVHAARPGRRAALLRARGDRAAGPRARAGARLDRGLRPDRVDARSSRSRATVRSRRRCSTRWPTASATRTAPATPPSAADANPPIQSSARARLIAPASMPSSRSVLSRERCPRTSVTREGASPSALATARHERLVGAPVGRRRRDAHGEGAVVEQRDPVGTRARRQAHADECLHCDARGGSRTPTPHAGRPGLSRLRLPVPPPERWTRVLTPAEGTLACPAGPGTARRGTPQRSGSAVFFSWYQRGSLNTEERRRAGHARAQPVPAPAIRRAPRRDHPARQPGRLRGARRPLQLAAARLHASHARLQARTPRTSCRRPSPPPTARWSPTSGRSTSSPGSTGSPATARSTTCAARARSASTTSSTTSPTTAGRRPRRSTSARSSAS